MPGPGAQESIENHRNQSNLIRSDPIWSNLIQSPYTISGCLWPGLTWPRDRWIWRHKRAERRSQRLHLQWPTRLAGQLLLGHAKPNRSRVCRFCICPRITSQTSICTVHAKSCYEVFSLLSALDTKSNFANSPGLILIHQPWLMNLEGLRAWVSRSRISEIGIGWMVLVWVSQANVAWNNWRDSVLDWSILRLILVGLNLWMGQIYHKAIQSRYDLFDDGRNDPLAKDNLSIDSTNHPTERPGTFHQSLGIKDQSDQKDMEKVVTATLGAAQQVESRGCHFMCLVILPNQHEWIWNDLNDLNGVHWISCSSHFSPLCWPNCSWRSLKRRNHLITLTGWTLVKHSEALRSTWIT